MLPQSASHPATCSRAGRTVEASIRQVLADRGKACDLIQGDCPLMGQGLGLDSLDFAVLVIRLEESFGFDPFMSGQVEQFPYTVDDLIALYEDGSAQPR